MKNYPVYGLMQDSSSPFTLDEPIEVRGDPISNTFLISDQTFIER